MGHEHHFEFTRDEEAVAEAVASLNWPQDADEQIQQVQRCTECGQLNRVAWVGGDAGVIPPWLVERLIAYANATKPSGDAVRR